MRKASNMVAQRIPLNNKALFILSVLLQLFIPACHFFNKSRTNYAGKNWTDYAGDNTKSRYSTLNGINKQNVNQLKVSWTYRSGDFSQALKTTIECNPVIVDGILYASTPTLKLVALNAATGKEIWRYDPLPPEVLQELRKIGRAS